MIGLYVDPLRSPTSCALFMRLAQDRALADGIPLDSAVRLGVQGTSTPERCRASRPAGRSSPPPPTHDIPIMIGGKGEQKNELDRWSHTSRCIHRPDHAENPHRGCRKRVNIAQNAAHRAVFPSTLELASRRRRNPNVVVEARESDPVRLPCTPADAVSSPASAAPQLSKE
ncbi:hypothetical protein [Agromyces badenianii]|uniref:hypothetical protein n=1 Tax=Agromyces badenianii TaxID=2080742 RepID=UPI0011B1EEE3|nr:hypothetical protein [Agromyces badenianii]